MSDYTITVHRYGLMPPLDWGDDCDEQMRQATALWNRLVEIEAVARTEIRAVTAAAPEIATLQAEYDRLLPDADTPETKVRLKDLRTQLAVAGRVVRSTPEAKVSLAAIDERRKAAVKLARQEANATGLWWGNANAILADYGVARSRAIKDGAELRPRDPDQIRYRVFNQVQGGITVQGLTDGDNNICQVLIGDAAATAWKNGRIKAKTATLVATVYARGHAMRRTVTWPMILHRPFPAGSIIQQVDIIARRCADRIIWQASFLLRVPSREVVPPLGGGIAGIDVGWRIEDDRSVRVAAIVSTLWDAPRIIRLPAKVLRRADSRAKLQSERNEHLARGVTLAEQVDWSRAPDALRAASQAVLVAGIPTSALLRNLVSLWQREYNDFAPGDLADLWSWRVEDGLLWRTPLFADRHVRHWRRDMYANLAAELCRDHVAVGVEKPFIAQIVRGKAGDGMNRVRYLGRLASPAEMIEALHNAARKSGTRIVEQSGESSFVCHACGAVTAVAKKTVLHFTCGGCGRVHDQDVNAAWNILAAAQASAPAAGKTTTALAPRATRRLEGLRRHHAQNRGAKSGALANETNNSSESTK